jgi:cytoskeletal protein RodZ
MDNNPQQPNSETPSQPGLPKLRPYQIPAAQQKARDEKEATERRERIEELRKEAEAADLGKPKRKHRFLRSVMHFFGWILLIVVLTAGGGYAGWYFLLKPNEAAKPSTTSQQAAAAAPEASDANVGTKHYESPNFSLALDYPQDWIVTDSTTRLTIASPVKQLKSGSTTVPNAQTTLTIQAKQASLPAFKNGNATAIRESEKIAYAKPSSTQRANSYLSFLAYAGSATTGLDGVYVTGDNGYQVGQAIPQVDIAKADPSITVTFASCTDSKCSGGGKPLTLSQTLWDDNAFSKPIKTMLQSLVVQ